MAVLLLGVGAVAARRRPWCCSRWTSGMRAVSTAAAATTTCAAAAAAEGCAPRNQPLHPPPVLHPRVQQWPPG
eukprot:COSAG01_NODE_897_length_12874_cov_17.636115_4_plen_73_part_00